MKLLTTHDAAVRLGIAVNTMRHHCREGNIEAEKVGRDWVISEEALERFEETRRPPGRPPSDHSVR